MRRRHGARWLLIGALTLAACSGGETGAPGEASTHTSSGPDTTARVSPSSGSPSGRDTLNAQVAPMRASAVRWARGNVPRDVPPIDDDLPSLLTDPPGRALVASYVPRRSSGWADESVEFYGADGRWRRLRLGDLDLPEDGWRGGDTFGAGALSPDGRWWAGPIQGGFFVLDLRDGTLRVPAPVLRRHGQAGMPTFWWSPDSDEVVVVVRARASRAAVTDLRHEPFPRPAAHSRLLPDGGWVECPRSGRVISACTTYAVDGTATLVRDIPSDLRGRWAAPLHHVPGGAWISLTRSPYGNLRQDWEMVLTDQEFRARSRLLLPAGSQINDVADVLGPDILGLQALDHRLVLAFLADSGEIVRLLRPGRPSADMGYNFWVVSFAQDLLKIR